MISGLQKMTLLDFPGKIACTVFLQGCNYRCPFCHNSELLPRGGDPLMTDDEFFSFLEKRQGLLDGVCVSGGEPTLQPELEKFLRRIKALGFSVKLDTNGSRPEILAHLLAEKLVDYVAMDVKNSPARYGETVGLPRTDLDSVSRSLRLLLEGNVDYELRTTVVAQLHDARSVVEMGAYLASLTPGKKPGKWFLQSFVDRDTVTFAGLLPPAPEDLAKYAELLRPFADFVAIRGV